MDLMEYQAKQLFAAHDVPVNVGEVAETPDQAEAAAEALGGRVVVKAQVKAGGRGKAGGVKVAEDPQQARELAAGILGMSIKGMTVRRVLVAPAVDIAAEYYFSYLVDRSNRAYLSIASVEGGVEIEEVARTHPDAVARVRIDPAAGVDEVTAREIVAAARFPAELAEAAVDLVRRLWDVFIAEDATLVEVNPLGRLRDGSLEALDAKMTLDANAAFRHPGHARFDTADDDADSLESRAAEKDLNYVKLDGEVGIIGNGAGLVMSTLDVVAYAGEQLADGQDDDPVKPANFLDIGGGASAQVMADGLEIVLGDPAVTSVFVNVFGGITSCDAVADGIVSAFRLLADRGEPVTKPLVVRLDGNNAEQAREILSAAGLPGVEQVDTMDGAARRAAELAAANRGA